MAIAMLVLAVVLACWTTAELRSFLEYRRSRTIIQRYRHPQIRDMERRLAVMRLVLEAKDD